MAFVYKYLAADGTVLYVGKTVNLQRRMAHHNRDTWISLARDLQYIDGISKTDADILETFYINLLNPVFNTAKRWDKPSLLQLDRAIVWKHLLLQPNDWQPAKSAIILYSLICIQKNLKELEKKAGKEV